MTYNCYGWTYIYLSVTFVCHGCAVRQRVCDRVMAIEADQVEVDKRPSCTSRERHYVSCEQFNLIITGFMDAVNHQTPGNKYWLSYQTSQTISSGQTAQQNIAGDLQGRCLDDGYNDSQVSNERKDAERYINSGENDIIYEGSSVVVWDQ